MSNVPPRLVFAFFLIINVLLWTSSNHARNSIMEADGALAGQSLLKRTTLELANTRAGTFEHLNKTCRPVANPVDEQCRHVTKSCPKSDTFLSINYLKKYYCTDTTMRPLAFIGLVIWLFFLFSTLGISAADFFTPNLATIAKLLGLDENVAGVTFLAFGNGSPDVFSTFSAMKADSGSLAIGELLGAASFIVSCVVGSMCIIKPFQVQRWPFLRDVGFFSAAVVLLLVILWDHIIKAWEASLMVGLYVLYVVTVMTVTWWEKRRARQQAKEDLIRGAYSDDNTIFEPYRDDDATPTPRPRPEVTLRPPSPSNGHRRAISAPTRPQIQTNLSSQSTHSINADNRQIPHFSLLGAIEFRDVVQSLQRHGTADSLNVFDTPVTPHAGGRYRSYSSAGSHMRSRRSSVSTEHDPWDAALANSTQSMPMGDRSPQRDSHRHLSPEGLLSASTPNMEYGHPFASAPELSSSSSQTTVIPSILHTPASPTASEDIDSSTDPYFGHPTRKQRIMAGLRRTVHVLFPTMRMFLTQSVLGKVASLFAAPAVLALTITLPVVVTPYGPGNGGPEKANQELSARLVDFEEEGVERVLIAEEEVSHEMHEVKFDKWLTVVQCVCAPLFCVGVLFKGYRLQWAFLIAAAGVGVIAATLVAIFAENGDHPGSRMARCMIGFGVAIVWIMAIADEVVNVLKTFGFIFGLSDAIIGLTIFAVGNSLADLVANMSVAVFAPIMGFSACFGGPMLNILLGIGISGSFIINQRGEEYNLFFGKTLFVSTIGLMVLLLATLVFVPMNDYFLTRRWGILLVICYVVLMTINVVVELKSENASGAA